MPDDIRALTARLAEDPASLAFLELGEALRRRRQLEAAAKVAVGGLHRYPDLADAHDLYARILTDQGDLAGAFDEWGIAVRLAPSHPGANKGIGFLYFTAGDPARALEHLELAAAAAPDDAGVMAALERIRGTLAAPAPAADSALPFEMDPDAREAELFAGLEGADSGLLLVDGQGLRLAGGLQQPDGTDVSEVVAGQLAGVSREAGRTARLLELGAWQSIAVESDDARLHLVAPTEDTMLLAVRDPDVPAGRLALMTERAGRAARHWLEQLG